MADAYLLAEQKLNADQRFLIHASEGKLDELKEVFPKVANKDVKNEAGMSALTLAVKIKHTEMLGFLLEVGLDVESRNNVSFLSEFLMTGFECRLGRQPSLRRATWAI